MIKDSDEISGDSTVRQLYDYIVGGGFEPGDKLPVREDLQAATGLGPRRLREALSVLEHQGVLESRNKGGTIVRKATPEKLAEPVFWCLDAQGATPDDLLRARACMEGAAAFEAARKRTARDLLNILDALEKLEARQTQNQFDWEEEREFHMAILAATHNPVMLTFEKLVTLSLERGQQGEADLKKLDMTESNQRHREIFQAINDGDGQQAMTLMYDHIVKV